MNRLWGFVDRQLEARTGAGSVIVEGWSLRLIGQLMLLAACSGLLVGFLGPFGTYEQMPLAQRLVFWIAVLTSAASLHIPALWLWERLGQRFNLPLPFWISGAAAMAAAPTALLVLGIIAARNGTAPRPPWSLYGFVFSISLPMQILSYALRRASAKPSAIQPHSAEPDDRSDIVPTRAPLFDLLPLAPGDQVLCLQMEDHYVRVHTSRGSSLLLMPMREAVAKLEGVEGVRVHRSWWVARNAVVGREGTSRNLRLQLSNGLAVPVSRDRLADLNGL